jgi:hypothetical protein
VLPEFADGQRGLGTSGDDIPDDQIVVEAVDDGSYRTRPAGEVIGWRVVCDCYLRAWAGRTEVWASDHLWTRVPSPMQHDPDAFRIYVDDAHVVDAGDGDDLEDAARRLWRREHIDAIDATAGIKAAVIAVRSAQDALDDGVRAARSRGLSWAKIGAAAGVSAQAAHERWSKITDSSTSRVTSERTLL